MRRPCALSAIFLGAAIVGGSAFALSPTPSEAQVSPTQEAAQFTASYAPRDPEMPGIQNPFVQQSVYFLKDAVYSNAYANCMTPDSPRCAEANALQATYDAYQAKLIIYNDMPSPETLVGASTSLLTLIDHMERDRDFVAVVRDLSPAVRERYLRDGFEAKREARQLLRCVGSYEEHAENNAKPRAFTFNQ